jgi:hypothetical protein
VLPTLNSLSQEAIDEDIPVQPSQKEEQQLALANQLVQGLKVGILNLLIVLCKFI